MGNKKYGKEYGRRHKQLATFFDAETDAKFKRLMNMNGFKKRATVARYIIESYLSEYEEIAYAAGPMIAGLGKMSGAKQNSGRVTVKLDSYTFNRCITIIDKLEMTPSDFIRSITVLYYNQQTANKEKK